MGYSVARIRTSRIGIQRREKGRKRRFLEIRLSWKSKINKLKKYSVAEPPLFWAAPAPGGQGLGADSASDLLGSAPAPG